MPRPVRSPVCYILTYPSQWSVLVQSPGEILPYRSGSGHRHTGQPCLKLNPKHDESPNGVPKHDESKWSTQMESKWIGSSSLVLGPDTKGNRPDRPVGPTDPTRSTGRCDVPPTSEGSHRCGALRIAAEHVWIYSIDPQ